MSLLLSIAGPFISWHLYEADDAYLGMEMSMNPALLWFMKEKRKRRLLDQT
jgi:hypothetical protein